MSTAGVVDFLLAGFTDNSGNPLAGGLVYTYSAGTTTPKATYTDRAKVTPEANPIVLDSNGRKQVYADGSYKLVVKTAAGVTLYTYDNLSFGTSDSVGTLGTSSGAANVYALTPSPALSAYTVGQVYVFRSHQSNTTAFTVNISGLGAVNAKLGDGNRAPTGGEVPLGAYVWVMYEADNGGQFRLLDVNPGQVDGFLDASIFGMTSTAINTALGLSRNVRVPSGTWSITAEIAVTADYQHLHFEGAILQAASNSINMIHWSGSHGKLSGKCRIDANSHTSVSGLRVTPVSETQTITVVNNTYNSFFDLYIYGCQYGVVVSPGPTVTGTDSGAWYNRFYNIHCYQCTTGFWFKEGITGAATTRNKFYSCRAGQSMNTGYKLDAASTMEFHGCDAEGISSGTTPTTTPTAIYIAHNSVLGGDNNSNRWFGGTIEGCTRHINNDNDYTELYGLNFTPSLCLFTRLPGICFTTGIPFIRFPGIFYQANGEVSTYYNGINFTSDSAIVGSKEIADMPSTTRYPWQTYALTTSNISNVTSISGYNSKYRQFNGICKFDFRFGFRATVAGTVIRINLPLAPDSTMYRNTGTTGTMRFPVVISGAAGTQFVVSAQLSDHTVGTPYIEIPAPVATWDSTANNNQAHGQIEYHV